MVQGQDGLGRVWESEFRADNKGGICCPRRRQHASNSPCHLGRASLVSMSLLSKIIREDPRIPIQTDLAMSFVNEKMLERVIDAANLRI